MKILFVTNGYPTAKHPEYCVFTKEQIEAVKGLENINGEVIFINSREHGYFEYIRGLIHFLRKKSEFDVIHCFHGLTFLLVALFVRRQPIVVSFLNSIDKEYSEGGAISKPLAKLTRKIIRMKNTVFLIFKDRLPEEYSDIGFYLPNGVSLEKFSIISRSDARKALGLPVSGKYILFVSSKDLFRPQKRFDRFLQVIDLVKMRYPNLSVLTLVNEGRNQVSMFFNAADVHLLTSDFEGSPNSVKEAMACGVPVVSTAVGNVEQMLAGVPGCYVDRNFDPYQLAQACIASLDKQTDRDSIRRKILEKHLDDASSAIKLREVYLSAVAGEK